MALARTSTQNCKLHNRWRKHTLQLLWANQTWHIAMVSLQIQCVWGRCDPAHHMLRSVFKKGTSRMRFDVILFCGSTTHGDAWLFLFHISLLEWRCLLLSVVVAEEWWVNREDRFSRWNGAPLSLWKMPMVATCNYCCCCLCNRQISQVRVVNWYSNSVTHSYCSCVEEKFGSNVHSGVSSGLTDVISWIFGGLVESIVRESCLVRFFHRLFFSEVAFTLPPWFTQAAAQLPCRWGGW
jgi:hypothetical protein